MGRRQRSRGGPLPRARSRRRGPRDAQTAAPAGDDAPFAEVIAAWLRRRDEPLESLDLRAFLRECPHPERGPGERLRRLAVALDDGDADTWRPRPLERWGIFARVYDASARYEPANPWLHHSRALTAIELAIGEPEGPARARLLGEARAAIDRGLALAPDAPDLHYLAGYIDYFDAATDADAALERFDRALALDPRHLWAGLYRAHCLHDRGRWREAAEAYAAVDLRAFTGHAAWRGRLALEQRADCLRRAGDRAAAQELFASALERRERAAAEGLRLDDPPRLLAEAARAGDLPAALVERLRQHLEATGDLWVLDDDAGPDAST